jgi:hypothetical protein
MGDDPVVVDKQDSFGRLAFADRVVGVLDAFRHDTESGVVAVVGPWGSGKTSLLNLIRNRLSDAGPWRHSDFNPWMLSDLPTLVREFFVALGSAVGDKENTKKLRERLGGYAANVAPLGALGAVVGIDASGVFRAVGEMLDPDKSLEITRHELVEALAEWGKPVLVIVDDLDRLHPDELLLALKMFRLVGRLPNTYYLLAFDEETILDVIEGTQLAAGSRARALDYLEKMIQVKLDLPPVHPIQARALLLQRLDSVAERYAVNVTEEDGQRLGAAYMAHMASRLAEPRSVKRFVAHVEALYPVMHGEVNFVDFVLVTFLVTQHPDLMSRIRSHKQELTRSNRFLEKQTLAGAKEFFKRMLEKGGVDAEEQDELLNFLGQMFLPVKSALSNMSYDGPYYKEAALAQRVGSAEYFDRYFYLGISPDDVADSVVGEAVVALTQGRRDESVAAVEASIAAGGAAFDKVRRFAPVEADSAAALLRWLAGVESTIPKDYLNVSAMIARPWGDQLFGVAVPDNAMAYVEELVTLSTLQSVGWRAVRAMHADEENVCAELLEAVAEVVGRSVGTCLAGPAQDAEGLINQMLILAELTNETPDLWRPIDEGRWTVLDALTLFVPLSVSAMGQLLGMDRLCQELDGVPVPEPEDESDASWESRGLRGLLIALRLCERHVTDIS